MGKGRHSILRPAPPSPPKASPFSSASLLPSSSYYIFPQGHRWSRQSPFIVDLIASIVQTIDLLFRSHNHQVDESKVKAGPHTYPGA